MTATETATQEVKVGDFFYASWGYDQTNIDYFKVVGMTASGKSVRVQQWSSKVVSSTPEGSSVRVVPGAGPDRTPRWIRGEYVRDVEAPVETKRVQVAWNGEPRLAWRDYADLHFWNGTPKSQTGSGWGH